MKAEFALIQETASSMDKFLNFWKTYFKPTTKELTLLELASSDADTTFTGTTRATGEPGVEHSFRVALIPPVMWGVWDIDIARAAILHDIVEDFKEIWTNDMVEDKHGERVGRLVELMYKPDKEEFGGSRIRRDEYHHAQFAIHPREFFVLRLSDRIDNLMTLHGLPHEDQYRILEVSKRVHMFYAKKHNILVKELTFAILRAEKRLREET